MLTPAILVGRYAQPVLLRVGSGYTDDGEVYDAYGKSVPVAPAGPGGECIFTLLYLTTLHYDDDVSVWVTPILDGTALPATRVDLTGVAGSQGERQTHEVGLSLPYTVGGVEKLRYAPRGTWFECRVETRYATAGGTAAKQIIESAEVEFEIVRESRQSVT